MYNSDPVSCQAASDTYFVLGTLLKTQDILGLLVADLLLLEKMGDEDTTLLFDDLKPCGLTVGSLSQVVGDRNPASQSSAGSAPTEIWPLTGPPNGGDTLG